jgi:hypothetical protein
VPRAAGAPAQQTQLNLHSTNHALLAQQDIAAPVHQPDTLESHAIGVYPSTARRAMVCGSTPVCRMT